MAQGATARILIQNLSSDTSRLQFSHFAMAKIENFELANARGFFPKADSGDWILTWEFAEIPPGKGAWSGFGGISDCVENALLLFRLYKPGDISFPSIHLSKSPDVSGRVRNPAISYSVQRYQLNQSEVSEWQDFVDRVGPAPQMSTVWFRTCRRWFLDGGNKEFNPKLDLVDRVVDYSCALEAVLVAEQDFVGRRLRERATRLLALEGESRKSTLRLLKEIYSIRSTLVHGNPLDEKQTQLLCDNDRWLGFEKIIRSVIVHAIKTVPSDDRDRRSHLSNLYEPSDQDRAAMLRADFKKIGDPRIRQDLLECLKA
jgi:hypothetical protein